MWSGHIGRRDSRFPPYVLRYSRHSIAAIILNDAVPCTQRPVRAPEPSLKLVQKESGVLATKKLLDYVLSLAGTAPNVHRLENGDGVLEQELCIASSASVDGIVVMWRVTVCVEKFEDPQLAA
ncbi:hypothetical protein OCU04_007466 [Sclerotinia nivalis]|uniref:Uncharacterized protein n=1 Tax=Sclerotinia nivalis TaxID=352851 RepID=A0A9X0AIU6_9HELO|nr:hypothetical protein OCU04_007466 [Sclerotinia nivalis]